MTSWILLVDSPGDLPNAETPHKVMTTRDYLSRMAIFEGLKPKVVNLSRSYAYQGRGYYCSLLAEARGHRVIPAVQTMLELERKSLYQIALPELEDALAAAQRKLPPEQSVPGRILVCFGRVRETGFQRFASLLFDWFRCPIVEVVCKPGERTTIERLKAVSIAALKGEDRAFFLESLGQHTAREWRAPKQKAPAKFSLAVLHDPAEQLPPSKLDSLKRLAAVGERMGIEVDPITRRDLARLAEYDALFIRETTSIDNHTYRFARRAAQEGMPVIDDPVSMIRCTNKVYLAELLTAHKVPIPKTRIVASEADLKSAEEALGYPLVVKIPDGSFSRGVHKAETPAEFRTRFKELFEDTDLVLAQEFMPTEFDWRVGVLGGEPLFVCQYLMAHKHWQIVRHGPDGFHDEGRFKTFAVEDAPAEVVDVAVRAARLIGDGLYGVDLKQNEHGVFVIEINDNPNMDAHVEGAVLKDEMWRRLLAWFEARV